MTYKMGIDLGGTKTEVVVLGVDNIPVYQQRVATPALEYDAILAMIDGLVADARRCTGSAMTIGIGTPGAISPRSGLLRNSNTVCMNGRPVRADLEELLGESIRIENDANCFALSEAVNGAGRGYATVFGIIIGTGTGGGLVVNGRLVNGPHSITGEWGHNPLPWWRTDDGKTNCYCGKQSCIETYLSGPGLANNLIARCDRSLSSEEIVTAALSGDKDCQQVMQAYHDQLARALAHLINIIDPEAIVLGGGMSNIDSIYRSVPRLLNAYVFSDYVETPLLQAQHGDASGVLGAALLWE